MSMKPSSAAFHAADRHLFAIGIQEALEAAYEADDVVPREALKAIITIAQQVSDDWTNYKVDPGSNWYAKHRALHKQLRDVLAALTDEPEFPVACDDTWHGDPDQAARRCPTCDGTRPRNPEDAVTA